MNRASTSHGAFDIEAPSNNGERSRSYVDDGELMERFGSQKQAFGDDDVDENDFDMMEDTVQARRKALINGEMPKKFDFPDPIYPNVINIGNVCGTTVLD